MEPSINWTALGAAIKAARKHSKRSQPEIAEQLKFPQSAISFAEKGLEGRVSLDRIKQIAEAVGVEWQKYTLEKEIPTNTERKWCCNESSCPGAFPILLDTPGGWAIRMRPYRYVSRREECPLCGEDGMSLTEDDADPFLEGIPQGYAQLVATFDGPFDALTEALDTRRAKLIQRAKQHKT